MKRPSFDILNNNNINIIGVLLENVERVDNEKMGQAAVCKSVPPEGLW